MQEDKKPKQHWLFGILYSNSVGKEEQNLTVKILEAAVDTLSRFKILRGFKREQGVALALAHTIFEWQGT